MLKLMIYNNSKYFATVNNYYIRTEVSFIIYNSWCYSYLFFSTQFKKFKDTAIYLYIIYWNTHNIEEREISLYKLYELLTSTYMIHLKSQKANPKNVDA